MLKKPKIGIRLDSNSEIGYGHFIRCHALTEEFINKDCEVVFLITDNETQSKIIEYGYPYYQLDFNMNQVDPLLSEFKENLYFYCEVMKNASRSLELDILIIDNYQVYPLLMSSLKRSVDCLVYIDDLNAFDYDVNVLINGNISAPGLGYNQLNLERDLLIGSEYTFIRKEFIQNNKRVLNNKINKVMITTGGANPHSMLEKITEYVLDSNVIEFEEIHIIIGSGFLNYELFANSLKKHENVIIHINPPEIWHIMSEMDLAISSGGSTLYELCVSHIPTIGFVLAENQLPVLNQLAKIGCVFDLGRYDIFSKNDFENALEWISDFKNRKAMIACFNDRIDGKGPTRVVDFLIDNYSKYKKGL